MNTTLISLPAGYLAYHPYPETYKHYLNFVNAQCNNIRLPLTAEKQISF